jgi:hypothetical protein
LEVPPKQRTVQCTALCCALNSQCIGRDENRLYFFILFLSGKH